MTLGESKPAWQAVIGFCGVLEGNGHTISNLTVPAWNQGLFGAIGLNAKIQNVNFTNVVVGEGSYLLAYAVRNATMQNVNVEFNVDSPSCAIAYTMNDCEFKEFKVTTRINELPFMVGENASNPMPETVALNFHTYYKVVFNTDGGNEINPVLVTAGGKIENPGVPVKTSEEYNYEFIGWFYNDAEFDFGAAITSDVELIARWKETKKANAADVVALIAALPDSVVMPDHLVMVPRIEAAKNAYEQLDEATQAAVSNYSKLQSLLNSIVGYETVLIQNTNSVNVIPAYLPGGNTSTTGGTATMGYDNYYGNYLKVESAADGTAAIQYIKFPDVSKYTKVYFNIRIVGASADVYLSDGTTNDGWGDNWKNTWDITGLWVNDGNWSQKSIDVSTGVFASNVALGFKTNVRGISFEITDFVGYYEVAASDTKEIDAASLFSVSDTGTTNEYGKVYNLKQGQWFIDNAINNTFVDFPTNKLAQTLPNGYDHFEFWLYNPTDTVYNFHLAGSTSNGWADSSITIPLAAKAWTKVNISKADIENNKQGAWYFYILGGNGDGAAQSGWQISSVYAIKL